MKQWIGLALLSAFFAALVGIAGKRGLETVDPTTATAVRSLFMAGFLVLAAAAVGKLTGVSRLPAPALGWIAVSGLCGAASWLCYFWALRSGPAGGVAALDRVSVAFTLILAAVFLKERLSPQVILGGALMVIGAVLVVWRR